MIIIFDLPRTLQHNPVYKERKGDSQLITGNYSKSESIDPYTVCVWLCRWFRIPRRNIALVLSICFCTYTQEFDWSKIVMMSVKYKRSSCNYLHDTTPKVYVLDIWKIFDQKVMSKSTISVRVISSAESYNRTREWKFVASSVSTFSIWLLDCFVSSLSLLFVNSYKQGNFVLSQNAFGDWITRCYRAVICSGTTSNYQCPNCFAIEGKWYKVSFIAFNGKKKFADLVL